MRIFLSYLNLILKKTKIIFIGKTFTLFKSNFKKLIFTSSTISLFIVIIFILLDTFFKVDIISKFYRIIILLTHIPESFISQSIDILLSIASTLLTLLAIITALHSKKLEDNEVKTIKTFLENLSQKYSNVSPYHNNYDKVMDYCYDIKINLQKYKIMYDDFMTKNSQIIYTNKLYETLSDLSFACYFITMYLNFLTLKIENIYTFASLSFVICILFTYFWSFYKVNLLPLIQIKNYVVDFPSYEDLATIHKEVTVPYTKVNPVISLKLFSLSSFFKLHENFYSNIESIDFIMLPEYNINTDTKITITYNSKKKINYQTEETLLLGDLQKKEANGYIYYSFKPSCDSIITFKITLQSKIFNQSYETSLIYKHDTNSVNKFICKIYMQYKSDINQ